MRVVGVGGGHGLAATLQAALRYAEHVAAVVTVADDGGSSGRLTRELGVPPPGDIRNCLAALSADPQLTQLYQHRFKEGPLTGHSLGNLVIAALTEITGDFAAAIEAAACLMDARGDVFPATSRVVTLNARTHGGIVQGQVAVDRTDAPIESVYLDPPDAPACPGAVAAIERADQVVLGPGSLFTSVIAALLVPGVRQAVLSTRARRVFVCNSRNQKGETEGLDVAGHIEALLGHVGDGCVDTVVVQAPAIGPDGVRFDASRPLWPQADVVAADVADPAGRHAPDRLGRVLAALG